MWVDPPASGDGEGPPICLEQVLEDIMDDCPYSEPCHPDFDGISTTSTSHGGPEAPLDVLSSSSDSDSESSGSMFRDHFLSYWAATCLLRSDSGKQDVPDGGNADDDHAADAATADSVDATVAQLSQDDYICEELRIRKQMSYSSDRAVLVALS